jgi:hypothetical protein
MLNPFYFYGWRGVCYLEQRGVVQTADYYYVAAVHQAFHSVEKSVAAQSIHFVMRTVMPQRESVRVRDDGQVFVLEHAKLLG